MTAKLLIECSPGEVRAYLVAEGRLGDIRIERDLDEPRLQEIWLGRIVGLLPAMPAALVDLGEERPALLEARDLPKGMEFASLHEGQAVIVQVRRAAQGGKSTGLTMRVRLVGSGAVLRPFGQEGEKTERRGGREPAPEDIAPLERRWTEILARSAKAKPPERLEAAGKAIDLILAAFAETPLEAIVLDDRGVQASARHWCLAHRPEIADAVTYEAGSLLDRHEISDQVETLFTPRVALPGGGAITIEPVTAATFIDVDSGTASLSKSEARDPEALALKVNLEAAEEVARQLRLRNLAGAVVVDFISLQRRDRRDAVLARLRESLRGDTCAPDVKGWTKLGHIELTRRRERAPLHEILYERRVGGGLVPKLETLALEALRRAAREGEADASRPLSLAVHPGIAGLLEGPMLDARRELERRLGRPIDLASEPQRAPESFDIRRL